MRITNGTDFYIKMESVINSKKYYFWVYCDEDGKPETIGYAPPPFTGTECDKVWAVSDKIPTGFTVVT